MNFVQIIYLFISIEIITSLSSSSSEWHIKHTRTLNINSQLVLNCPKTNDLIWIGWSHYSASSSPDQQFFTQNDCWMNFTEKIAEQCNGLNTCEISAQPTYIHKCSKISDYLFISYKCYSTLNTIDICSNIDINRSTSDELLITSPDFPDEYSPTVDCSCRLSSSQQPAASLKLEILWFSLQDNDYLSIARRNFSGWISPTHEFPISFSNTTLRFISDDSLAYKGFWLKIRQTRACRDDWQLVGNTCVKVISEPLDWRSANQKCNQMNGYLIKLDDVVSDLKLSQYMKLYYPEIASYWIGLRKYVDVSNQEKWMWSNSTLFEDATWWPWKKSHDQNGNCVVKRRNEDGYFTLSCDPSNKNSFICQTDNIIEPVVSPINLKCGRTSRFYETRPLAVLPTRIIPSTLSRVSLLSSIKNDFLLTSRVDFNKILNILPKNDQQRILSSTNQHENKFNTTIIAGMVSGIGLVILVINILVLIMCRRNLKKLLKGPHKLERTIHKHGDEITQEYFDSYRNGINGLARPIAIQNSNTLLIPVTTPTTNAECCSSDELISNKIRDKSLRSKSAFKIVQANNQYDKMNHQIQLSSNVDQNYFHTYECVDPILEMPGVNRVRNFQIGPPTNNNNANYSLNSDFGFNSTSTSSSSTHQLLRNSAKILHTEGTWSPDSAYYSSILTNGNYQLTIIPSSHLPIQQNQSHFSCINQNHLDNNFKSHLV